MWAPSWIDDVILRSFGEKSRKYLVLPGELITVNAGTPIECTQKQTLERRTALLGPVVECKREWSLAGKTVIPGWRTVLSKGVGGTAVKTGPSLGQEGLVPNIMRKSALECLSSPLSR
jgi:hypothetical protein